MKIVKLVDGKWVEVEKYAEQGYYVDSRGVMNWDCGECKNLTTTDALLDRLIEKYGPVKIEHYKRFWSINFPELNYYTVRPA